jgi:hypothetical protein
MTRRMIIRAKAFNRFLKYMWCMGFSTKFDYELYTLCREQLRIVKQHGGELFDEEVGLIRTQLRVRLCKPKTRIVREL